VVRCILDEEKPRNQDQTINNLPFETEIDEGFLYRTIREIKTVAARNDHAFLSIAQECQTAFEENSQKVTKICSEHQVTADKLERWMENYMILKRKMEQSSEIYKRELNKSWSAEKEYSVQITTLCETINKLTNELVEGKTSLINYSVRFEKVCKHLQIMEENIVKLHEQYDNKLYENESRLASLNNRCELLKRDGGGEKRRASSSSSRRLSKTLFNLKRRLSETNESVK